MRPAFVTKMGLFAKRPRIESILIGRSALALVEGGAHIVQRGRDRKRLPNGSPRVLDVFEAVAGGDNDHPFAWADQPGFARGNRACQRRDPGWLSEDSGGACQAWNGCQNRFIADADKRAT